MISAGSRAAAAAAARGRARRAGTAAASAAVARGAGRRGGAAALRSSAPLRAAASAASAAASPAAATASFDKFRARPERRGPPYNLFELIAELPVPVPPEGERPDRWALKNHKHGLGLRFTRSFWRRYPEPSYWTITRVKPAQLPGRQPKAWGVLTWRGVEEGRERRVACAFKRQWRLADKEVEERLLGPGFGRRVEEAAGEEEEEAGVEAEDGARQ